VTDPARFLGRGIAFPPRVGADGRVAWSTGDDNIRDAIRVILQTDRDERLRLPQFGAGLDGFLFEPNTVATHRRLEDRIATALGAWEPRIAVESVDVAPDPDDGQAAVATIQYRLVATQAAERLTVAVGVGA
jgi:phage baseplate assembly protein W